jgi:uncharacterized protein YjgD (DUF1641 family)
MANPIDFKPRRLDPRLELERRLYAAPIEHAEALLVAFDILEEAHRQGLLDALHGAIGARDTIASILAHYSAEPVSVNALRNLIALGKLLGTLDPEPISKLSKEMVQAVEAHRAEPAPPSLWQLWKRMRTPESRRGLSLATTLLGALGRATK